jgi:hypothetical protein
MSDLELPIDPDAFEVHTEKKYEEELMDIMDKYMQKQKTNEM